MKKKEVFEKYQRWKNYPPPYEVGRDGLSYKQIPKKEEDWVEASTFRPLPFDLVKIQTGEDSKMGWWTGVNWDGYRIKGNESIRYWKKINEFEELEEKDEEAI